MPDTQCWDGEGDQGRISALQSYQKDSQFQNKVINTIRVAPFVQDSPAFSIASLILILNDLEELATLAVTEECTWAGLSLHGVVHVVEERSGKGSQISSCLLCRMIRSSLGKQWRRAFLVKKKEPGNSLGKDLEGRYRK